MEIIAAVIITIGICYFLYRLTLAITYATQARGALQTGIDAEANRRHDELLTAVTRLTSEIGLITTAAALRDNKTDIALEEFRERLHRSESEQFELAVRVANGVGHRRIRVP